MGITSFYFLCFFAVLLLFYYSIPRKFQWGFLLACSVFYCLLAGQGFLVVYPLASAAVCYAGTALLARIPAEKAEKRRGVLMLTVLANIGILFVLKYVNFFINTIDGIVSFFGGPERIVAGVDFLAPLGISFYTFSLLGYVFDVYYGLSAAQKNFGKLALYGLYFPNLISGPILKYREHAEQFFSPHAFEYRQVTRGLQRMVWGFFKKLVIAERLGVLVDTVYGDYQSYPGAYIWAATAFYAFQLYTDFSGCMDIVLGMSESLGIVLPENFQTPFFSKSVAEYWRRWHITLGVWMKDYVFYPLMRTKLFTDLNKSFRKKFGKKRGKQFAVFTAMFVLWLTVGIWHGGDWKFVIGSGLLHWFYIVMEELLAPPFARFMARLHIDAEGRFVALVRMFRTFFFVCVGDLFFRAPSAGDAFSMLKGAVGAGNVSVLWDGSLLRLGLDGIEMAVAFVSLLVLWVVSLLQRDGQVRDRIAKKPLPLRWALWYALLFAVILLGCYGPGYSASEFIYQGF